MVPASYFYRCLLCYLYEKQCNATYGWKLWHLGKLRGLLLITSQKILQIIHTRENTGIKNTAGVHAFISFSLDLLITALIRQLQLPYLNTNHTLVLFQSQLQYHTYVLTSHSFYHSHCHFVFFLTNNSSLFSCFCLFNHCFLSRISLSKPWNAFI